MSGHERRAPISQPTAERTSDQSTPSASGLTAERPGPGPERQYDDDVVPRTPEGHQTPRNYDRAEKFEQGDNTDDPVMPSDDSSLNTKI
jgi:hypothetical protein